MTILQTPRTIVRQATLDDAAFVIELLNEPGWIRFIGDRDIHDLDAARAYIHERLLSSYAQHDTLDAPDIGYAVCQAHQGKGYAFEVCQALVQHGWENLGFDKLYGYCLPDNVASVNLLEKLGMTYLRDEDVNHSDEMCRLYRATRP